MFRRVFLAADDGIGLGEETFELVENKNVNSEFYSPPYCRSFNNELMCSFSAFLIRTDLTAIKDLSFCDAEFTEIGFEAFHAAITKSPSLFNLKTLTMTNCYVVCEGSEYFAHALRQSPHLTSLQSLHLSNALFCEDVFIHFLDALVQSTHLTSLEELDLSQNGLGDSDIGYLSKVIISSPHLQRTFQILDLSWNYFRTKGFQSLALAIHRSPLMVAFRRLDLSQNKIGIEGCIVLSQFLSSSPHLISFETLQLANCGIQEGLWNLASSFMLSPHLISFKHLDLSCNSIQSGTALFLADCLVSSPHLTSFEHLGLDANLIHEEVALKMVQKLLTGLHLRTLKILDFSFNNISDEGFCALSLLAMAFPHLRLKRNRNETQPFFLPPMLSVIQRMKFEWVDLSEPCQRILRLWEFTRGVNAPHSSSSLNSFRNPKLCEKQLVRCIARFL